VEQRSGNTIAVLAAGVQRQSDVKKLVKQVEGLPDSDLERHIGAIAGDVGPTLIKGNSVRLLVDGPMTYAAMFKAIASATSTINVEIYIFESDEMGHKLKDALIEKQRSGVKVRLIYDSLGCLSTPKEFFQEIRDAGIEVGEFNPVDPAEGKLLELNNRDHRKLLIVDGAIAFTGGINISSVYSRGSASRLVGRKAQHPPGPNNGWRDTQIEVKGPAVAALQQIFFETWNSIVADKISTPESSGSNRSNDSSSDLAIYYPDLKSAGDKLLRVVASSPNDDKNIIYTDFLVAMKVAKKSIHVTMAYFSPDEKMIGALCEAAGRQVDVQLVLPGFSDIWLIFEAGRAHYTDLLQCGVKIYERHDALLHAKTIVIDGVWSTVGSSNMDMRSFLHNREVNVVVLGTDFAEEMETMFQHDIGKGKLVTLEAWSQRPLSQRLRQWFASTFSYWL
jgi:cardiolipin synthase